MPILGYVEAGQATAGVQGDLSVWMRGHKEVKPSSRAASQELHMQRDVKLGSTK